MNEIITVKDLKKSYGNNLAVKGISFAVRKGQLFAFLGPNGAGKSTTISTICTFLEMDSGEVTINGHDLKTQQDQLKKDIGVVFQEGVLDGNLTIEENLEVRACFYFKKKKDRQEAIARVRRQVFLDDIIGKEYKKLSGGQRRRADIARALLNEPKILFLDEPTTGLDPQTRKYIWETIVKLQKEENMTVFLTTQYMEETVDSDYVVIIDKGRLVAQGTPYELKRDYSYDHILIKPRNRDTVINYLEEKGFEWEEKNALVRVKLACTLDSIDILHDLKPSIDDVEVRPGSMDDVFLNITGKDLRK